MLPKLAYPLLLTAVVLFGETSSAQAEARGISVSIRHSDEKQPLASIWSDVEAERRQDLSIAEACTVLKAAQGWGSRVWVIVVADRSLAAADVKAIFDAVAGNPWLELSYFRMGHGEWAEKFVKDHHPKPLPERVQERRTVPRNAPKPEGAAQETPDAPVAPDPE